MGSPFDFSLLYVNNVATTASLLRSSTPRRLIRTLAQVICDVGIYECNGVQAAGRPDRCVTSHSARIDQNTYATIRPLWNRAAISQLDLAERCGDYARSAEGHSLRAVVVLVSSRFRVNQHKPVRDVVILHAEVEPLAYVADDSKLIGAAIPNTRCIRCNDNDKVSSSRHLKREVEIITRPDVSQVVCTNTSRNVAAKISNAMCVGRATYVRPILYGHALSLIRLICKCIRVERKRTRTKRARAGELRGGTSAWDAVTEDPVWSLLTVSLWTLKVRIASTEVAVDDNVVAKDFHASGIYSEGACFASEPADLDLINCVGLRCETHLSLETVSTTAEIITASDRNEARKAARRRGGNLPNHNGRVKVAA